MDKENEAELIKVITEAIDTISHLSVHVPNATSTILLLEEILERLEK